MDTPTGEDKRRTAIDNTNNANHADEVDNSDIPALVREGVPSVANPQAEPANTGDYHDYVADDFDDSRRPGEIDEEADDLAARASDMDMFLYTHHNVLGDSVDAEEDLVGALADDLSER